jgi:hypothetical protein
MGEDRNRRTEEDRNRRTEKEVDEHMARRSRKDTETGRVEIGTEARGSDKIDKDKADSGRHPVTGPKDAPTTGAKGRGDG